VLKVPAPTAVPTMSFCAGLAAAGIAHARTLRINAKLAAFTLSLLLFIFLFYLFSVALLPFAVLTIENKYLRNTKNNEMLQFV
jgi:hypothetical protein